MFRPKNIKVAEHFSFTFRTRLTAAIAAVALMLSGGALVAIAPSVDALIQASIPLAPFNACPSVGYSPSCQIFLVVNPDRTVSVYGDPNVGPYDGGDDTLVGVRNDSALGVDAITVTGPGTYLGVLDWDGLCAYAVTGCPFGPTGYEGPGTSIVTVPSLPDSAEVDFTGSLAPGASTYFSLEGALSAAQLTSRQGHIRGFQNYVALGDSYSSGEGAAPPPVTKSSDANLYADTDTENNRCHRSHNAYSELLKNEQTIPVFSFNACSGALLSEMTNQLNKDNNNPLKKKYSGQWDEPAQLDHIAPSSDYGPPNRDVDLVTLSIGGNDAGFAEALTACIHGYNSLKWNLDNFDAQECTKDALQARFDRANKIFESGGREKVWSGGTWDPCVKCPLGARHTWYGTDKDDGYVVDVPSLSGLYAEINKRAPKAKIRVMLYPRIFPQNPTTKCTVGSYQKIGTVSYWISADAMKIIGELGDQLNAAIIKQVDKAKGLGIPVDVVDPRPGFATHAVCDAPSPYINGLIRDGFGVNAFSFHPNKTGHQVFNSTLKADLGL